MQKSETKSYVREASMRGTSRFIRSTLIATIVLGSALAAHAQTLPPNAPTKEQLANDNNLFLSLARKALKWEEPVKIVGPGYFVGTKGLGIFLFATSEGHILMNALVRADDRRVRLQAWIQT